MSTYTLRQSLPTAWLSLAPFLRFPCVNDYGSLHHLFWFFSIFGSSIQRAAAAVVVVVVYSLRRRRLILSPSFHSARPFLVLSQNRSVVRSVGGWYASPCLALLKVQQQQANRVRLHSNREVAVFFIHRRRRWWRWRRRRKTQSILTLCFVIIIIIIIIMIHWLIIA